MSHIFCLAKRGGLFSFNTPLVNWKWLTNRKRFYIKLNYCICNRYIEKIRHFQFPSVLDLLGVGGLISLVPLNPPPSFYLPATGLVENSHKYIADPIWFYHKSSTSFHSTVARTRVKIGVRFPLTPPKWRKVIHICRYRPNFPEQFQQCCNWFPNRKDMHIFSFSGTYLSEGVFQMGVRGVLKLEPQTFQWIN